MLRRYLDQLDVGPQGQETTNDLYAFLTTEPNAEVGSIHPKAMPVILTTPDEVETWMTRLWTRRLSCSGRSRTARSRLSPAE